MRAMRILITALGSIVILAYAVLGALLMTRWELTAASGLSIEETVAEMQAAGQPYSLVAAVFFAICGMLLSLAWAVITLAPAIPFTGWFSAAVWGAILALGAPAYFFASFGNMMSVGDTLFSDWNPDAAFALVAPLYLLSGLGALIAVAAFIIGLVRTTPAQTAQMNAHSS